MKKIRTVIVDDEVYSRRVLIRMLKENQRLDLVGESSNVDKGLEMISELKPDLVFTDIDLGNRTGFDLVRDIPYETSVIFLTAHPDFAVRAFEVNAVDYLLKPIEKHRLDEAISRLSCAHKKIQSHDLNASFIAKKRPDSFLLATSQGTRYVETREISMILSQGNFTLAYVAGSLPIPVYRTMKEWRELLPSSSFVLASRSMIINVDAIEAIVKRSPYSAQITLKGMSNHLAIGRIALRRLRPVLKRLRR